MGFFPCSSLNVDKYARFEHPLNIVWGFNNIHGLVLELPHLMRSAWIPSMASRVAYFFTTLLHFCRICMSFYAALHAGITYVNVNATPQSRPGARPPRKVTGNVVLQTAKKKKEKKLKSQYFYCRENSIMPDSKTNRKHHHLHVHTTYFSAY